MPLISVVMPVYNGADYLETAVRSVLDQTVRDLELVVVDDGSSDESVSILDRLANEDPRLRIECLGRNQGHHVASNRALELAQGELIARHDQDDLLTPDWLKNVVDFMGTHRGIGLVGGSYRYLVGEEIGRLRVPPERHTEIRTALVFKNVFAHPGIVMRASLRATGELYYRDLAGPQDYDLWVRLLDVTRGANLPREAVLYRQHATSMSAVFESEMPSEVESISDRQIGELLGDQSVGAGEMRAMRRLWRGQELQPDDEALVDAMRTVFDELEKRSDIDRSELRAVRNDWLQRVISAMFRTTRRPPWRLLAADPLVAAQWMTSSLARRARPGTSSEQER